MEKGGSTFKCRSWMWRAARRSMATGRDCPLQPGCLLTWLAFKSDDGVLLASDSQGSFWLLVDDFGHRWAPALDAATTRHNIGDREWPVYAKHGSVHCCVLKGADAAAVSAGPARSSTRCLSDCPTRRPRGTRRNGGPRRAWVRPRLSRASGLDSRARLASSPSPDARRPMMPRSTSAFRATWLGPRTRPFYKETGRCCASWSPPPRTAPTRAYDLARRLQLRESLDLARRIAASHGEDALTARVEDLIAVADGASTGRGRRRGAKDGGAFPVPSPPINVALYILLLLDDGVA